MLRLDGDPATVDQEAALNQAFHFEIYNACGSPVLIPMIESLWLQSGPCTRAAIFAFSEAGKSDSAHFHLNMIDALAAGDAQAAREALVADISRPFAFLRKKLLSKESRRMNTIRIRHEASGMDVLAVLSPEKAPANAAFLWRYLETPRVVPGIHAMWTGPEISCPIPTAHFAAPEAALPPENATLHPQPGDIVLAYVPARMWGGNS